MKFKALLLASLATVAMAGCTKNDVPIPTGGADDQTVAYLSLQLINTSNGAAGKAVTTTPGSEAESKVDKVQVLLFNADGTCVGSTAVAGVVVGNGTTTAAPSVAFEVPSTTTHIFVVANNYDAGWNLAEATIKGKHWGVINATINATTADVATDNKFMMANAGAVANGALTPVTVFKPASDTPADIQAAKDDAVKPANSAQVYIDRLSAKVTLTTVDPVATPNGGVFAFQGWEMNITNKSVRLYSDLIAYANATTGAVYRQDGNYTKAQQPIADMNNVFNYLTNGTSIADMSPVAKAKDASTYCLENTMDAPAQQLGYTTKAVVKAAFTPAGLTAGVSFFAYQGVYYSLATLKTKFAAEPAGSSLRKDARTFFALAGLCAADATEAVVETLVASLDDTDGTGNLTAYTGIKAKYQALTYYHKSVSYYDILIRHDQAVSTPMALGRYGVVRNNWYTLTINSVAKPGTPWIPDPTDPTDPTDPDTDDDETPAYLSVTINVNPWTTWAQGVDL